MQSNSLVLSTGKLWKQVRGSWLAIEDGASDCQWLSVIVVGLRNSLPSCSHSYFLSPFLLLWLYSGSIVQARPDVLLLHWYDRNHPVSKSSVRTRTVTGATLNHWLFLPVSSVFIQIIVGQTVPWAREDMVKERRTEFGCACALGRRHWVRKCVFPFRKDKRVFYEITVRLLWALTHNKPLVRAPFRDKAIHTFLTHIFSWFGSLV